MAFTNQEWRERSEVGLSMSFAAEVEAAMHQPVMPLEAPVSDSKGTSANPVGTFDEVILKASEGDTMRAMDVVNDVLFSRGKDYTVTMGSQPFSNGMLTLVDEVGLEVPRTEVLFIRKELPDTFMLIPKVDERVEMLDNLRTKRDEMTADAQSIIEDLAKLDEFDADDYTPFGLMSDAEKGALLLADSEGKEIQGFLFGRADLSGWSATDRERPTWNPRAYYRVKPLSYELLNSILSDVESDIADINSDIRALEVELGDWWE